MHICIIHPNSSFSIYDIFIWWSMFFKVLCICLDTREYISLYRGGFYYNNLSKHTDLCYILSQMDKLNK